jgi:hypothetical protein
MTNLRQRLQIAMDPQGIFNAVVWGNPRPMTAALREVRKTLGGGDGVKPSDDILQASMRSFASTQEVASFTALKYVCYGVTLPVGENHWRLIDRPGLFDKLLGLVEQRSSQLKQFRRCYQGLLTGYFGFDKHAQPNEVALPTWHKLRAFLDERLQPLLQDASRRPELPDWLRALSAHQNLLSEDPCTRYARELQLGRVEELKALCADLGISATSWVWGEALMAYVGAVCESSDAEFCRNLPAVLKLVNGETEMRLAQILCTRAVALVVSRYARCDTRPEHPELRDASVHWIGNPWVNRTAWDAQVKDEPARQLIEGWLKRRLIKDFFELLAHDGSADLRRLNYWLKWEPQITDMWFVLGEKALRNKTDRFTKLRKLMEGRDRILDGSTDDNNAFVMRIGPLLVIEFGVTNNACFAFAAADFNTSLTRRHLGVYELKQKSGALKLSHMSGWESRFDYELRRMLQSVPSGKGELKAVPAPKQRADVTLQAHLPSAATRAVGRTASHASTPASLGTHPVHPLERPTSELSEPTPPAYFSQGDTKSAQPAWPWPSREKTPTQQADTQPVPPSQKRRLESMQANHRPPEQSIGAPGRSFSQAEFDLVRSMCTHKGFELEDNRSKKGALWVLMPDRKRGPGLASLLDSMGFRYTEGKGFLD